MHKKLISWYMSRAAVPFWFVFLADCAIVYLSGLLGYAVNHGLANTVSNLGHLLPTMLIYLICFVIGFRLLHTYSGIIRQTTFGDLAKVCTALLIGVTLIMMLRIFANTDSFMLAIEFNDLINLTLIATVLMCGMRVTAKIFYDLYLRYTTTGGVYGYSHKDLIDLEMADLLPRKPIAVDMNMITNALKGKRIMVTGAAGSIGSELVNLLANVGPAELILIDQAESPLHDVRINMHRLHPSLKCATIVTSICHSHRMERIFIKHRPEIIFHAAAYKHVPMMEDNPVESVLNNVDGTKKIADLAVRYDVKKFVMVSTDKAVNPTNVMGCSKRVCEMYCQSLSAAQSSCQFITTRFGNVLGSNGSVIPTFRDQIRRGGPVMVTHPKIIRYFMLIPEACSLVLQAAAIGNGGEIFAFDMGQPVKIVDLAKRMITLSGRLNVKIEFTGLRPGEKLYEEVLTDKEVSLPTSHPKIKVAKVRHNDYATTNGLIKQLIDIARTYDETSTVRMMKQIVPEYTSPNSPYSNLDTSPAPQSQTPETRHDNIPLQPSPITSMA